MKQYAFLEYTFIFDPAATWQHMYQFEDDLANFFAAHGFEANILKSVEGGYSKRMVLIAPLETVGSLSTSQPKMNTGVKFPINRSPKQIINDLRSRPPSKGELEFKQKYKK